MNNIILKRENGEWKLAPYNRSDEMKYLLKGQFDWSEDKRRIINYLDLESHHQNIILVGIKCFDLIRDIVSKLSKYSTLILIELTDSDEIIVDASIREFQEVMRDERVTFIFGPYNHVLKELNSALYVKKFYYNAKNFKLLTMPYTKSLNGQLVTDLFNSTFEQMSSLITAFGNSVEDILVGYDNLINNWELFVEGMHATKFKNTMLGKPCIIVGAGPSLDRNIDVLKEMQPHVLIIAVDAVLSRLLDEGIIPDIVATIERTEKSSLFYMKYDKFDDIIFLGPSIIQGDILSKFNKRIFTGRDQDTLYAGLNEKLGYENLEIGFNAAHLPLSFAKYIGCDPIIFVGLDLAYSEDRTHTGDVGESHDIKNLYFKDEHLTYVKGQNGERLKTLTFFVYAKKYIEQLVLMDKQTKYYNATEGGAEIHGAINIKLNDMFDLLKESAIKKANVLTQYNDLEAAEIMQNRDMKTESCIEFFDMTVTEFVNFIKEINEKVEYLEERIDIRFDNLEDLLQELDQIRHRYPVPSFILQSLIIRYNNQFRDYPVIMNADELESLRLLTLDFYKNLIAVSDKVIESFDAYLYVLRTIQNKVK